MLTVTVMKLIGNNNLLAYRALESRFPTWYLLCKATSHVFLYRNAKSGIEVADWTLSLRLINRRHQCSVKSPVIRRIDGVNKREIKSRQSNQFCATTESSIL